MRIYDGYERLDLTEGMRNKDCPNGDDDWGWCAGEQLKAMEYYCPDRFRILYATQENDYTGDIYGVAVWDEGSKDQRYVFWTDGFGSCSGCDGLEGSDGYEYIHDVLMSDTWQFLSLEDLRKYLDEPHERLYWDGGVEDIKMWLDAYLGSSTTERQCEGERKTEQETSAEETTEQLKPCPFCGSTDLILEPNIDGWVGPGIKCRMCEMYIIADMDGPGVCADQILVEQWNALPRKSQEKSE